MIPRPSTSTSRAFPYLISKMDFVVFFGKTCHFEEEKDLCQKLHYALLYEAWMGKKYAAEDGQTNTGVLFSQSVYNVSFEGWSGFVDCRQLFWCARNYCKPEYSKAGSMACSDKIKSMANGTGASSLYLRIISLESFAFIVPQLPMNFQKLTTNSLQTRITANRANEYSHLQEYISRIVRH